MAYIDNYSEKLLAYKGPVNIDVIVLFSNYMKKLFSHDQSLSAKMYKIFVELTQNISYYSQEYIINESGEQEGIGEFYIKEDIDSYNITTFNRVSKSDAIILQKNCGNINDLNREEVRDLKRKTRVLAGIKDRGAHIGLMHLRLLSNNVLAIGFEKVDDHTDLFSISIKVNKMN